MCDRCQICGCATSLWMGALSRPQGRGPPLCPMAEEEGHVSGRQGMECPESWHITLCLKVVFPTATQSWSCSEMSEGKAVPAAAFCPLPGCRKVDTALIQPLHCKRDGFTLVLPMVSQHSDAFLGDGPRSHLLCEWWWDISSPQLALSQGTALGGNSLPWDGTRAELRG